MEDVPFPGLNILNSDFMQGLSERSPCPKCHKSRMYYCYNCYVPVHEIQDKVPRIKLPLKIDIIKHPKEVDGKSTAVHAAVLAPDDVTIYTYPCIPDYDDESKVVLVFPKEGAISMQDLSRSSSMIDLHKTKPVSLLYDPISLKTASDATPVNQSSLDETKTESNAFDIQNTNSSITDKKKQISSNTAEEIVCYNIQQTKTDYNKTNYNEHSHSLQTNEAKPSFERVVFIDCTWHQINRIYRDDRLKGLTCIELCKHKTKFWRHQRDKPDHYLATIEAIYYFLLEYHQTFISTPYEGDYDNLLFFFVFMYKKIRTMYNGGKNLKAYKKQKVSMDSTI